MHCPVCLVFKVTANSLLAGNVTAIHWGTMKSRLLPSHLYQENSGINQSFSYQCKAAIPIKCQWGKAFPVQLQIWGFCGLWAQNILPLTSKSTERNLPPLLPHSFGIPTGIQAQRSQKQEPFMEITLKGPKPLLWGWAKGSLNSVQSLGKYTSSFGKITCYLVTP